MDNADRLTDKYPSGGEQKAVWCLTSDEQREQDREREKERERERSEMKDA